MAEQRETVVVVTGASRGAGKGIAVALGKEQGMKMPLADATRKQYERMIKEGLGTASAAGIAVDSGN